MAEPRVRVRLEADPSGAQRGFSEVEAALRRLQAAFARAGTGSTAFRELGQVLQGLVQDLRAIEGGGAQAGEGLAGSQTAAVELAAAIRRVAEESGAAGRDLESIRGLTDAFTAAVERLSGGSSSLASGLAGVESGAAGAAPALSETARAAGEAAGELEGIASSAQQAGDALGQASGAIGELGAAAGELQAVASAGEAAGQALEGTARAASELGAAGSGLSEVATGAEAAARAIEQVGGAGARLQEVATGAEAAAGAVSQLGAAGQELSAVAARAGEAALAVQGLGAAGAELEGVAAGARGAASALGEASRAGRFEAAIASAAGLATRIADVQVSAQGLGGTFADVGGRAQAAAADTDRLGAALDGLAASGESVARSSAAAFGGIAAGSAETAAAVGELEARVRELQAGLASGVGETSGFEELDQAAERLVDALARVRDEAERTGQGLQGLQDFSGRVAAALAQIEVAGKGSKQSLEGAEAAARSLRDAMGNLTGGAEGASDSVARIGAAVESFAASLEGIRSAQAEAALASIDKAADSVAKRFEKLREEASRVGDGLSQAEDAAQRVAGALLILESGGSKAESATAKLSAAAEVLRGAFGQAGEAAVGTEAEFNSAQQAVGRLADAFERAGTEGSLTDRNFGNLALRTKDLRTQLSGVGGAAGDAGRGLATAGRSADAFATSLRSLLGTFLGITGVRLFMREIGDSVTAALDEDQALLRLNTALKLSGEFSKQAASDMQSFARELALSNAATRQSAVDGLILAKSFGATNEQAKELVKVSFDLAAATGTGLTEAITKLGSAMNGVRQDQLAKIAPEIRGLSAAQLAAGEATRIVGEALREMGSAIPPARKEFAALAEAWNDLQAAVGRGITSNEDVQRSISRTRENLEEAADSALLFSNAIAQFVASALELTTELAIKFNDAIAKTGAFVRDAAVGFGILDPKVVGLSKSAADLHSVFSQLTFRAASDEAALLAAELDATGVTAAATEAAMTDLAVALGEVRASSIAAEIERIEAALEAAERSTRLTGVATDEFSLLQEKARARVASLRLELEGFGDSAREAQSAMELLGQALGVVTSADLEREILTIERAIDATRKTTDSTTREFIRMEEESRERIAVLRERILAIRDGMGDLSEESARARAGLSDLSVEVEGLGEASGQASSGMDELTTSARNLGGSVEAASGGFFELREGLLAVQEQVVRTALEFDRLAKSAGDAAAVQAAVAGGQQVTSGGTRIRFQGGGSRLVPDELRPLFPGLSGSTGVFTVPQRRSVVGIDGRIYFLP